MNKNDADKLSCYAFVQADGFCYRANNLTIYAEANRQIMGKVLPCFQRERTNSSSTVKTNQFNLDSLIGDNTKIGDKSKVTNSILMDDVKIGDGVVIQGSIICSDSILYSKSEFKDCLVSYEQDVITTGKYSNETI